MEKPTSILISGTYDHHHNTSEIGTDFRLCGRDEATHVSVFLIDEHHHEPVRDFALGVPANPGAYADALTLAAQLAHEHDVGIVDRFQKKVRLSADSKEWPLEGGKAEPQHASEMSPAWRHEDSQAALREGWDLMECHGSRFGRWQIEAIDDTEEASAQAGFEVPELDDDAQAWLLVVEGTDSHHVGARAFLLAHNPEEWARMQEWYKRHTLSLAKVSPHAAYQSIQVAATAHSKDDIHVCEEASPDKTHYSVYLRTGEGLAEHVEDFAAGESLYSQALARVLAFNKAAHLSMQHGVPIEPIN